MLEFFKDHWNQIIETWNIFASIISFIVGGVAGYGIHFFVNRDKSSVKNKVDGVGGNFVGRDNYGINTFKAPSKK